MPSRIRFWALIRAEEAEPLGLEAETSSSSAPAVPALVLNKRDAAALFWSVEIADPWLVTVAVRPPATEAL